MSSQVAIGDRKNSRYVSTNQRSYERRQRAREIAERVFAEAIREIIAVNPGLNKEELFPRLCGRLHLDDETWGQYQALGRKT